MLVLSACHRPTSDAPAPLAAIDAGLVDNDNALLDATSHRTNLADASASSTGADGGPPIDDRYFASLPVRGKSIGHTSVVFKLALDGGLDVAYKPRSHRGGERFHGEIAAYRLAVALGLDNVPPAVPRSFPADVLRKSLDDQASALFAQEGVVEEGGTVRGALIP